MLSFLSQPLGPINISMSGVAEDAFTTAARDDTDPMRRTGRRTVQQGGTLQKAGANYIWTPLHAWSPRQTSSRIFRFGLSAKYSTIKVALLTKHLCFIYLQPMDRFWCVFKYEPTLINQYSTCLFVQGCMHSCMCSCMCCENVCVCVRVLWTPIAPHEILKGEDGDVRVLGLAGDVSWSSAGLWAVVMVVWPTHSLLPCSFPPPPSPFPLFSHCANDLHAWDHFSCPIAGVEWSLDVQQEPNSFKLLSLPDSDFREFPSWVDTDVLVSAIMGPLSFHANWSVRAELTGSQHREKDNL